MSETRGPMRVFDLRENIDSLEIGYRTSYVESKTRDPIIGYPISNIGLFLGRLALHYVFSRTLTSSRSKM